jgi:hypothetical protein
VECDGYPSAPTPPFADGAPTVGWLTYLERRYPQLPTTLPTPAVAHDLGTGTLFVAHSSKPDRDAMARLELALGEAVLIPAREMAAAPQRS